MAPNNEVQIHIDSGDARQRMEELKNTKFDQFPIHEDGDNSKRKLLHKELVSEKKVVSSGLYEAVQKGNVDNFVGVLRQVCEYLKLPLSNVIDQVTWAGDSLVHVAARLGKEEIVALICEHFHDLLYSRNAIGDTALHIAARFNNHNIVKFFISKQDGENDRKITRETNEYGNTPLHEAVCSASYDAVKKLIQADHEMVHFLNNSKQSPLYLAVINEKNEDILNLLLHIPFPEHQPLPRCLGNSPLHAAILEHKSDLIRKILRERPELVYLRDEDGGTPLHYATYIGYAEEYNIFLEKSFETRDLTVLLERNNNGHLPIHLACKRGHVEVVKKFFQHKWDFNPFVLLNKKGQNILHVAANNGKIKVVKYLLKNDKINQSIINQKDNGGNTPLHLASKNLFPKVLYTIARDKRTDRTLLNNGGLTALDIVERKRMSIRKFLASRVLKKAGVPSKANNMLHSKDRRPPLKSLSLKGFLDSFLVAATLMVTVTFAAGFTVPGGVYSSGDPNQGLAIFAHKPFFWVFTTFNMVAMYSSVIACGLMLLALVLDQKLAAGAIILAMGCLVFAFLLVPVAFMAALRLVVANNSALATVVTVIGTTYTSLILSSLVAFFPIGSHRPLFRQIGRFVLWILITAIDYDFKPPSEKANKDKVN